MPCPHCKITIVKRSENESTVSAAPARAYDQQQKYYPYKNEVTHKEILLPANAPPEYADLTPISCSPCGRWTDTANRYLEANNRPERPGLKRMLKAIERKQVNLVITKSF